MTYEQQVRLNTLSENYSVIAPFLTKYKILTYMQLDYAVVHEISLFMIEPDFDFDALEEKIDAVLRALPAIKRIFAQPFIHLKENDVILPIEAVRIIDNNTIRHVSSHSQLWSDVTETEIKPKKLLTRTYEDNYGIYENLVFCKTVDDILAFTRNCTRFLKELIYTNQTIEINLLERLNHINYFLALGKLHTGYNRNFETYYSISTRCLNKLQFISNTIVSRLKRPVYKNNKVRPAQIKLRKTNILSMHKEYHQIYKLAKFFSTNEPSSKELTETDLDDLQKTYYFYCEMLCIFAIGHFNFQCDENKKIFFSRLNMDFAFKQWRLKLKKETVGATQLISVEVKKENVYKIVLIPTIADAADELIENVKRGVTADEYVLCSPFEGNGMLVDISNIESFRRLQQLVLRAMIYADNAHDECPFCRSKLILNEKKSSPDRPVYTCTSCRTEIGVGYCDETDKNFYYTGITDFKSVEATDDNDWLADRKKEARIYFRNITELSDKMEIVCPHCGKIHK